MRKQNKNPIPVRWNWTPGMQRWFKTRRLTCSSLQREGSRPVITSACTVSISQGWAPTQDTHSWLDAFNYFQFRRRATRSTFLGFSPTAGVPILFSCSENLRYVTFYSALLLSFRELACSGLWCCALPQAPMSELGRIVVLPRFVVLSRFVTFWGMKRTEPG